MTRIPLPVVLGALALVAVPLVLGGAAPDALVALLHQGGSGPELASPPEVRLVSPEHGEGVGPTVRVTGEATSRDATVLDVQRRIDGGRWESLPSVVRNQRVSPFSFELDLEEGDHVLEVRATDGESYSMPARATVRSAFLAPPTVHVDKPADGAGVAAGLASFEGRVDGEASMVRLRVGDLTLDAPVRRAASGLGTWRADVPLTDGIHEVRAQALATDAASLPRAVTLAVADVPPPSIHVVAPVERASFGSAGDRTCVSPCIRFTGTTEGDAERVLVALDGAAAGTAKWIPGGAWTWELPLRTLFAGEHVARFTPVAADGMEGAPQEVAFIARTGRTLHVEGDDAPRLTRMPLVFKADGNEAARATWRLDGAVVARGPTATVEIVTPGDHTLTVEAPDADGRIAAKSIPLYAVNRPPTVELLPATGLAGGETRLTARGTDLDGEIVRYAWEFGDGRHAVTLDPTVGVRYEREGIYRVNVTALDDRGARSVAATLLLPVFNSPPLAAFDWSPREPSIHDTVVFTDHSDDPEGLGIDVSWDFGDGTGATGPVATHRFATRGNHTVALRVTDVDGGVDLASAVVHVRNLPPEPSFSWTPAAPRTGEEVTFRDESVKLDGEILERRWTFDEARRTAGERVRHVFDAPGQHLVTLSVLDDMGALATRTLHVTVHEAAPNVTDVLVEPAQPTARQTVRFQAVAFDLEGNLSALHWTFGDGGALDCESSGCPDANGTSSPWVALHEYARSGVYVGNVTAVDMAGLETTFPFTVRVQNALPQARLTALERSYADFPTTLWADASDPDGRVVRYRFDADGDGLTDCEGIAPTCVFTYPKAGSWLALVDVEDDEGGRATATRAIDVDMPPDGTAPPRVAITAPPADATLRGDILLRGTARGARPIDRVEIQLQDGTTTFSPSADAWTVAEGNETWHLLLDTRFLADGAYTLAARAIDASGAVGTAGVPIVVQNGPRAPLLSIQVANLDEGARVEKTHLVRGGAHHPAGVAAVRWRIDDGPWQNALGTPLSWAIPLDDVRPGHHALQIAAYRGIDEREQIEIPFELADTRPVLSIDLAPAEVVYGTLRVEGHVEGVARVLWRLDNHLWQELPLGDHWTLHEPTIAWPGGAHTVSLKAVNLDGGEESEVVELPIRVVKLQLDPPPQRNEEPAPARETPLHGGLIVIVAVTLAAAVRRMRLTR